MSVFAISFSMRSVIRHDGLDVDRFHYKMSIKYRYDAFMSNEPRA